MDTQDRVNCGAWNATFATWQTDVGESSAFKPTPDSTGVNRQFSSNDRDPQKLH